MNTAAVMRGPARQGGIVLVLAAVSLLVLLAMGAMALDVGHLILNKGKLQNMVDAAALSAAKTLDLGGDQALATTAAMSMLDTHLAQPGYGRFSLAGANIQVQFSDSLPFTPGGSANATFVRVAVSQVDLPEFFAQVLQLDMQVQASAVAGPSTSLVNTCNLVPMMVCAREPTEPDTFGYEPGELVALKYSQSNNELGPGKFQLLNLGDSHGADDIRYQLAGGYDSCFESNEEYLDTESGNDVGPVVQGLNTRLGSYKGPLKGQEAFYPPDQVITQPDNKIVVTENKSDGSWTISLTDPEQGLDFGLDDYLAATQACEESGDCDGVPHRRVLAVPVGECPDPPRFLGLACMYFVQEVEQKGNEAYVIGQFMEQCGLATGTPGQNPLQAGPYRIQLYRDNLSGDA